MDPATIFMQYLAAALSVWLLLSFVPSLLSLVSRVGAMSPVGRRVVAIVVSVILLASVARVDPLYATTGPPSQRMVEMVDVESPEQSATAITVLHRAATELLPAAHTVQPGDSLWRIARDLLTQDGIAPTGADISNFWRSMYDMNRDVIGDNPDLIHPGQVLQLPTR